MAGQLPPAPGSPTGSGAGGCGGGVPLPLQQGGRGARLRQAISIAHALPALDRETTVNIKVIPMDEQSTHDGSGAVRTTTEARQGQTTAGGQVRWMLGGTLALVVIGLIVVAYFMS